MAKFGKRKECLRNPVTIHDAVRQNCFYEHSHKDTTMYTVSFEIIIHTSTHCCWRCASHGSAFDKLHHYATTLLNSLPIAKLFKSASCLIQHRRRLACGGQMTWQMTTCHQQGGGMFPFRKVIAFAALRNF